MLRFHKNNNNHIFSVLAVFVPEHEINRSVCFKVTAGNVCCIVLMLVFLLSFFGISSQANTKFLLQSTSKKQYYIIYFQ